jgi:predicted CXXCH cytochrome family protein
VKNSTQARGNGPTVIGIGWNVMKYALLMTVVLAAVTLLPVPSAATANDLVVHAPLDKTIVARHWLNLSLEIRPGAFDEIRLAVNGGKPTTLREFHDGRFVCRDDIRLAAGVNRLVLTGYRNGRLAQEQRLAVFYQARLAEENSRPPGNFRREAFHRWEKERICVVCHTLEPESGAAVKPGAGAKGCFTCHAKVLAGRFRHEPTENDSCLLCHDRTSKQPEFSGAHAATELCAECHQDRLDDWRGRKHGHGPTSFGSCTMCHDPHAAEHPGLLRQHASDLCLTCHPEIAARPHVITISSGAGHPFRGTEPPGSTTEFSCASCHNPHAGNTPYFLNRFDGGSLAVFCTTCHDML